MKKGILVVSFGTSHLDTLEKTIAVMEREIGERFEGCSVYRAFTSGMIIRKLKRTGVLDVDTVSEALARMAADGIRDLTVQPTHIINGIENDRMLDDLKKHSHLFERICVGSPLLSSVEDYRKAIRAVMSETELEDGEALVLMGHGTDHYANAAYPALEYTFHSMGYDQVVVGTVEGFPELSHVRQRLEKDQRKKVTLLPFMLVAGDHAKNDMAGEEDSWKSELEEDGYVVKAVIKGLGEFSGIRSLFLEHMEECYEL